MKTILLIIGKKELDKPEEYLQTLVRKTLLAINPQKIITDYSSGWNKLVLDEARKIGVPYLGAIPYESPELKKDSIYNAALSNTVFNKTKSSFLINPFIYTAWLNEYATDVLAYVDEEEITFNNNILRLLSGKTVRNLYKK